MYEQQEAVTDEKDEPGVTAVGYVWEEQPW